MTWDAPTTGSTPLTYAVKGTPADGTVAVSGSAATITGLTNETSYVFTVTATNAGRLRQRQFEPVTPQSAIVLCGLSCTPGHSGSGGANPSATPELDSVFLFGAGLSSLLGLHRLRSHRRH